MTAKATEALALEEETRQQLNTLLDLLESEQRALKHRQFDEIDACVKNKASVLGKLEELERRRVQLMQSPGKDARELLEKCRELNRVNGGIVEVSRQFNQRMLDTLLGASDPENNLYDAAGNKPGHSHRQVMARI